MGGPVSTAKDPEIEHHLLEALWVHEHHDAVNLPLLKRLLAAKEFRARAAAVRVLQHWFDRVDGAMGLLTPMVRDEAPRVRLEAVRALSFVPTAAAAEAALTVLGQPMDYYLRALPRLDDHHAGAGLEAGTDVGRLVRDGQPGRPRLRA